MIKNITSDLHQFAQANVSIGKLYALFAKFLNLCAPLIKKSPPSELPASGTSSDLALGENTLSQLRSFQPDVFDEVPDRFYNKPPSPISSGAAPGVPQSVVGWDDSLMWELFDNQPSLEWAESELWDAMAQFEPA